MLARTVRFSLRFRGAILALAAILMAYGGYQLSRAGLDVFPEFAPKRVVIQTEASGLSAKQVEALVTQPIEQALSGVIGLERLTSESIQGLSVVTAVFEQSTDIYRDRQLVGERLAGITERLPPGVGQPTPMPLSSSSATVLTIGVTSERKDLMALRDMVDWTLVPQLLGVDGVADVNVFGGTVRQLQVQLRPEALRRYGLGIDQVAAAAGKASGIHGTGFVATPNQRLTLQVTGQPASPERLEQVVIERRGSVPVTLGDVADVAYGAAPPIGAAQIMGDDGIVMMVIGQYGANTLNVSRRVEKVLERFDPILASKGVELYPDLFRPADYIYASLDNILHHLLIGGALVVLVLLLVLFDVRTALISALAIPLSLLAATMVLLEAGVNINIMVLGGLAIALGEVADDAIIDTENIYRRLRENRQAGWPRSAFEVVYRASMEVRGSVVYASFIVALVFVPLLTLGGVAGRLFSPLGVAYILAILASLAVALTVTPALCYLLLARSGLSDRDPPLIRAVQPAYAKALRGISRAPLLAFGLTVALCGAGLAVLPGLGGQFLPNLREGHYIVHTTAKPGTSLQESLRMGRQLTEAFLDVPGVVSVSQWAGRAERGADTYGSHYSEFEVDLEPMSGSEQERVLQELRSILADFPGIRFEANTFLLERVGETIAGYASPVVVNIYGHDLDYLDRKANQVASMIREMEGATDVQVRSPPGTPMLRVRLRLGQLKRLGVRPDDAVQALRTAYEGRVVGRIARDNRLHDVSVVLGEEARGRVSEVGRLPVRNAEGQLIPLERIAHIRQSGGRYNVLHRGGQRLQTVTANVAGADAVSFMQRIRERLHEEVDFRTSVYPEITGPAVEQARARQDLILHSLLAGAGILVLIFVALGSLRHTALVLVNLPFSLVGGVAAVLITGGTLSVGALVGFVTLFGITVRNSIMLVAHYQHLVTREDQPWNRATAIRGAQERLPSILMTALVTALAMLPIAVNSDNPGREIMGPMAAIIIGGLASSTVLNLLILPSLMLRFGRFRKEDEEDLAEA
ncbi:efflux RND transporter permease subunit [Thiohalorhabdus sp. Cl-TMA]|uniref:Efflux RND transporter permease subunit n=1 Tax=Thiohalorhabdus methylotrophus TaxID=3242694 RepID=A0ABV4TY46_9GAMM